MSALVLLPVVLHLGIPCMLCTVGSLLLRTDHIIIVLCASGIIPAASQLLCGPGDACTALCCAACMPSGAAAGLLVVTVVCKGGILLHHVSLQG